MDYATRLHNDLTARGVKHTYENTGGGTMCTVVPTVRENVLAVMGMDEPTVALFTPADWYGDNEYTAEPVVVHEYDEEEYEEALEYIASMSA